VNKKEKGMSQLNIENYKNGFLIDSEWMASVTETEGMPGFQAYIVNHQSGDVVYFDFFHSLEAALLKINQIPRQWVYESASHCGSCGKNEKNGGSCSGGGICKKGKC
jgi:hypothetical protein